MGLEYSNRRGPFGKQWRQSLGYGSSEVVAHVSFWEELVHPEDMPQVQKALQKHFKGESETYECVNRLKKADGEWRWNLDRGRVVEWADDGKPLRMVGTDTDITERVQAERARRESEERLSMALEATNSGMWDWNIQTGEVFSGDCWF